MANGTDNQIRTLLYISMRFVSTATVCLPIAAMSSNSN